MGMRARMRMSREMKNKMMDLTVFPLKTISISQVPAHLFSCQSSGYKVIGTNEYELHDMGFTKKKRNKVTYGYYVLTVSCWNLPCYGMNCFIKLWMKILNVALDLLQCPIGLAPVGDPKQYAANEK